MVTATKLTITKHTLIEKDHLGDWSPKKDCSLRLTFQQPVRKPPSGVKGHLTLKMPSSDSRVT